MITIGIDFGGTSAKMAIVESDKIRETFHHELTDTTSFSNSLGELLDPIHSALTRSKLKLEQVSGLGIALPSIVDSANNKVLSEYVKYNDAKHFNIENWALENMSTKVSLENDAKAALVGENVFGAAKNKKNVAMITLGTGIGSAVIIDGKLIAGHNHVAGNLIGHTIINYDGQGCNCGGTGCAESEGSGWKIEDIFSSDPELRKFEGEGFKAVTTEMAKGNVKMQGIYQRMMGVWKSVMVNMVHCFDPEMILVGGGMMGGNEQAIEELQEAVNAHCWTPDNSNKIVSASLGNYAGAIGAACLPSKKKVS